MATNTLNRSRDKEIIGMATRAELRPMCTGERKTRQIMIKASSPSERSNLVATRTIGGESSRAVVGIPSGLKVVPMASDAIGGYARILMLRRTAMARLTVD
jgi:hypothetical protein